MEFTYFDLETMMSLMTVFGIPFGGGFMLSVVLHFVGYAVFGALSLLNIKK